MVSAACFFFLLPALVYGKFTIDIDLREAEPLIDVRGEFSSVINDTVREAFQIGDENIIKAVTKYKNDSVPVKVYVKRNEMLKKMYDKYDFKDVTRTVKPMLDIMTSTDCSRPIALNSDNAEMTIATEWKKRGNLSVELEYDVYIAADPSSKLAFSSLRGQKIIEHKEYKFGKVVASASKCKVTIDVQFESTLAGDFVAQYPVKREDHFFWAYDLARVQEKANLTTSVITQETITIVYIKESK